MKKLMVGVFISLTTALFAEVNFDQGVNLDKVISDSFNHGYYVPPAGAPRFTHYTRDCARFTFGPSDNEIMSEKVWLNSTEYIQECYTYYVPGPNGTQIPQQHCYERPGMSWHNSAQINIKPRKLYPWERETFEVCLEGPWMDIYKYDAAYKYSIRRIGNYDTLFELTPQKKIATDPDLAGIEMVDFSYNKETKKYTFKVSDKWAKEYAGEKVAIKIELMKSIANWFDSSKGEKEFIFDVAENYEMVFDENDLIKPQTDDEETFRNGKLFETQGYYLKWGFKRIGTISTDKFMKKGDTPTIQN